MVTFAQAAGISDKRELQFRSCLFTRFLSSLNCACRWKYKIVIVLYLNLAIIMRFGPGGHYNRSVESCQTRDLPVRQYPETGGWLPY